MLSDVFDKLCANFAAYGCPAQLFLGGQFSEQHTAPLRIVFVQGEDAFNPPNASVLGGNPALTRQAINPRPIATRTCGVKAELWATAPQQRDPGAQYRADLAYLDALINTTIAALQQTVAGLTVLGGGASSENNVDAGRAGLGYVLNLSVDVPIIDAPWPAQQLSVCSTTWTNAPATADVTVSAQLGDPPTYQPGPAFAVPTPED